MGFAAATALDRPFLAEERGVVALIETDGCFADGIEAATGCSIGHRTMRLYDCGRVAVTLADVSSGRGLRIAPLRDVRTRAAAWAHDEPRRYYAQLRAYQVMPDDELLQIDEITLRFDLEAVLGRKGVRVECARCREEVLNGRELLTDGGPVCPACMDGAYYALRI